MDYKKILSECVNFKLKRTDRLITRFMEKKLQQYKIRITQYHLLLVIAEYGDFECLTQLAKRVGVDRTTFTRGIQILKRLDFIECHNNVTQDQRICMCQITDNGIKILHDCYESWNKYNLILLDFLKEQKLFNISEKDLYNEEI